MLSTAACTVGKAQVAATGGGHSGLRDRVQAQSGGCDEAQRSLRAHKEPSEVVAGCALPGPGDTRQVSVQATCCQISG